MPRPDFQKLPMEWNMDMGEAPQSGRVIIAMGRVPQARAGYPRFVQFDRANKVWRDIGSLREVVCWAWMPREVLPFWPDEPNGPLGVVNTVGTA